MNASRSRSLFEDRVFIQHSPAVSRAGAQCRQHGILWSVAASCRNRRGNDPTLAASDHVRWLNKGDGDADGATGQAQLQSIMGKERARFRPSARFYYCREESALKYTFTFSSFHKSPLLLLLFIIMNNLKSNILSNVLKICVNCFYIFCTSDKKYPQNNFPENSEKSMV